MIIPATILSAMTGCSEAEAVSVPRQAPAPRELSNPELERVGAEEQASLQADLVEAIETTLVPGHVETPFGNDPCPPCGMG